VVRLQERCKTLGWRENGNSSQPGYFKYELIKEGRMQVVTEYAGSEAKVYGLKMVELKDKYLRCKGCPKHATKEVHFENVKAAALEKTVLSVEYNAIRLKNTKASHVREKR
jgi:hypothetical protein